MKQKGIFIEKTTIFIPKIPSNTRPLGPIQVARDLFCDREWYNFTNIICSNISAVSLFALIVNSGLVL